MYQLTNISSVKSIWAHIGPINACRRGALPHQDVELINADGVRGYLFPSGGVAGNQTVCVTQESYPSFTSSSSGGSTNACQG